MRALRRASAVAAAAVGLAAALGGVALADAPSRTGWWNAATAGGVALPQPTTGSDDLHVSQGASGPAAFAAVAYDLTGTLTDATLVLKVVPTSAVGTIDIAACPTKDSSWKAGGNQAIDTAPGYDCARGVPGIPAADGMTVTFLIDAGQQLAAGGLSLAVVPKADALPFSVDFVKPDASSLTAQVEAPAVAPVAAEPAAPPAPPAAGTTGSAPLGTGTVAAPPALEPAGPAPVAAPALPQPEAAPAPAAPVRAAAAQQPVSNRDRYAAGTLLALLAGAIVWALQQPRRAPRLIGGAARKAVPVEGGPAPVVAAVTARPRGIGRFATIRTAPARRLV